LKADGCGSSDRPGKSRLFPLFLLIPVRDRIFRLFEEKQTDRFHGPASPVSTTWEEETMKARFFNRPTFNHSIFVVASAAIALYAAEIKFIAHGSRFIIGRGCESGGIHEL
jgi:hypothetical protein